MRSCKGVEFEYFEIHPNELTEFTVNLKKMKNEFSSRSQELSSTYLQLNSVAMAHEIRQTRHEILAEVSEVINLANHIFKKHEMESISNIDIYSVRSDSPTSELGEVPTTLSTAGDMQDLLLFPNFTPTLSATKPSATMLLDPVVTHSKEPSDKELLSLFGTLKITPQTSHSSVLQLSLIHI